MAETLSLEEEISILHTQIADQERELRSTQEIITRLTNAPHFRTQHVNELLEQLKKKKAAFEILQEQADMYKGSDLQTMFDREVTQSKKNIQEYHASIQEQHKKNTEQDTIDAKERRKHQQAEQILLKQVNALKNKLKALEKQQTAKEEAEKEKLYTEQTEKYQQAMRSAESQEDIVNALAMWPDLQERFMQEHSLSEPTDGPSKIARAFIAYLDALIEDASTLQGVMVNGNPISEVLSLTDQEVMADSWEGGIDNLQRKRAALTRFV